MLGTSAAVKRVLIGRPRPSRKLRQQLLPKRMALPVLSSDLLSSVAYATQEMLLVLALAGATALALVSPLSLGVVVLLVVVVLSYRQVVRAYPHGGGAYSVARDNLGDRSGLVAAAALLIDYALIVAVSIAAAVAALVAAFPQLGEHRVLVALALLVVVTVANLRGAQEAGLLLAVPTYAFVAVLLALVVTGVVRCGLGIGGCPQAPSAGMDLPAAQTLTAFLVLRAFAAGGAALTGIEGTSNAVTAFRFPQSRNAATTLAIMCALAATLFLCVSYLAAATGVVAHAGMERTVVAEVALALFGDGFGFLLVQATTAAVLILAASTGYADFPRLASVLARDHWLPRQFLARGDRIMYSNGIVLLALAAGALLVAYQARVTGLVQLYVAAVFTAFTLSQTGMVRRWWRLREPGWQPALALNTLGAAVCALVVAVVVVAKLTQGVWVLFIAIPLLVALMRAINRHYADMSLRLGVGVAEQQAPRPHHGVILLDRVDEAAARALSYILSTAPASIRALGVPLPGTDLPARWVTLAPDVPLEILQSAEDPGTADALVDALVAQAERHGADGFTTAVIPETLSRSWVDQLREHRLALRLKAKLDHEARLVVSDITSPVGGPGPYTVEEPAVHHVVVLVNAVTASTVRALAYAESLHASTVRALAVNLDPGRSTGLLQEWLDAGLTTPIEVVDSPFRSLTATVRGYMRDFAPDGRHTVVTCVLPTFVLGRRLHAPLHNQSARALRNALLFERGIVTTTVPYPLPTARSADERGPASATPGAPSP